jgi:hypothetical protein
MGNLPTRGVNQILIRCQSEVTGVFTVYCEAGFVNRREGFLRSKALNFGKDAR